MRARHIFAIAAVFLATATQAQHGGHQGQSYAGQQARDIKALSDDEVKQYLSGAGMGYAKPAELNGHPGPMHVLELADKLALTEAQREATRRLMDEHKAEARALGAKRVAAERELDAVFRSPHVEQARLAAQVRAVAAADAEYRLSHLETHRRMRALLSEQQVKDYGKLRGY